jgi:phage-related protein
MEEGDSRMSSVDDRIVNMQFNNTQFQTGAADSTRSLQTLEQTIAKTGSSSGLTDLGNQVTGISAKFSALQVAGVTALATIVNKAVEAGLSLIKSLTFDPLIQGFQEYETNLNSIQTIMANTGKSVKIVNSYLLELNKYSDRTIYNFSQMAENIGRFTAAGVGLRDATTAIKGLANTAALSGSNVQQLNTAMYQMSQALSTGTIRLMDWNSLANAGMGGENIRLALMATNRTLEDNGAAMDEAISAAGSFRDSLQYGWLSAETFTKTMEVMAGKTVKGGEAIAFTVEELQKMGYAKDAAVELNRLSQAAIDSATKVKTFSQLIDVVKESIGSGWSQVFQNLFGNFNEATKLWTGVSENITGVVSNIFKGVNKMLEGWRALGGYQDLWTGIMNIFRIMGNLIQPFITAFQALLPTTDAAGSGLAKATGAFASFTGLLVTLTDGLNVLTPIITAVFSVFKVIASVVGQVAQGLAPVVSLIGQLASNMGDLARQGSDIGANIIQGMLEGMDVSSLKATIENFATSIVDWIKGALGIASPAAELVPVGSAIVQGIAQGIAEGIRILGDVLGTLIDAILAILPGLAVKLATAVVILVQSIAQVLPELRTALSSIIATLLGTIGDAIPELQNLINALIGAVINILTINIPKIIGVIDLLVTQVLTFLRNNVPLFIETGLAIILAIATGLAENMPMLVDYAAQIITTLGVALIESMGALIKAVSDNFESGIGGSMGGLDWAAIFNGILSAGLIAVLIQLVKVIKGFAEGITGPFDALTSTLSNMQRTLKAQALMAIAIAVGVLAAALIGLSLLKPEQLKQGLGAVVALIVALSTNVLLLDKLNPANVVEIASAIAIISGSMILLATAIGILGSMELRTLAVGLGAMGIGLGIMVVALKSMTGLGAGLPAAASGILLMAGAMILMAQAIQALGSMNIYDLAQGVVAMAIGLGVFVVALTAMASISATAVASAGAILILAGAMVLMAKAIEIMGKMSLADLAQGLAAMGIGLVLLVAALAAVVALGPTAAAAAGAIILMAGAMLIMAAAISVIGNLDNGQIAKGLVGLAGAFAILLLAAAVAAAPPIAAGLAVLGGVMLALGAGAFLLGVGLLAAATAFGIFATIGAAGVAVLVAGFTALMALLPQLGVQFAAAFVTFAQTIAAAAPELRDAFGEILANMLGAIEDTIPQIESLINTLLDAIFDIITKNIPKYGKVFETLIKTGLHVMRELIPEYVRTGIAIIAGVLQGIANKIDEVISAGTRVVVKFIEGIGDAGEKIVTAAGNTLLKFLHALDDWLDANQDDFNEVGRSIAGHILEGLTLGLLSEENIQKVLDAARAVVDRVKGVFTGPLGFIINSPSKVSIWWGEMIVDGLVKGITDNIKNAVGAAVQLANATIAAGDKAVAKAQTQSRKEQIAAAKKQARADLADRFAKAAEKAARKSPKNKDLQKAAKEARKIADAQQAAADAAQRRADSAAQRVQDVQAFKSADDQGKGDILTARAEELASRSVKKLAEANAAAQAAKKATGKERDRLLREAKQDAKAADKLASKSKAAQKRAADYYAQAVKDRIAAINEARRTDEKQQRQQDKFDNATNEQKVEILQHRADAAQKRSEAAQKQAEALVKQARKIAKTDAAKAQRLLDRAERLAQKAKASADEAKQAQQDADTVANQDTSTSNPATFQLSRSAMEDAASAIDRYTKSLQQAEEAATATTPVYQFVQYNSSPVALTDTEIYRQSKNLLSAAEIKMAVNPT